MREKTVRGWEGEIVACCIMYIRTEEKTHYTHLEHYWGKGNYRLQLKPESQYLIF